MDFSYFVDTFHRT